MGKHGMKERVTKNPDPTFRKVLGIFRKVGSGKSKRNRRRRTPLPV